MKGMQKISRGTGFRGVVKYAFADKKARFLCASDLMMSMNAKGLVREFGLARALRPDVAKPVWHQSLRLPKGEIVAPEKMGKIAHDYMLRMRFDRSNHQYFVVMHGTDHIHIVANRVGLNGKLWYGKQENLISTRVIQDLEHAHGLQITKGPVYESILDATTGLEKTRIKRPDTKKPKKNEVERHARIQRKQGTAEPLPRHQLLAILNKARTAGKGGGIPAFIRVAEAGGVRVQAKLSKSSAQATEKSGVAANLLGIAFELVTGSGALRISGSKLGAAYSGPALSAEFGKSKRDLALLQDRTSRFAPGRQVTPVPSEPFIKPKERVYGYRSSYTRMAATTANATCHRRTLNRAQTLDGVHALPGGTLAYNQGLRLDQTACILQRNEPNDLDAGPRTSDDGLRRAAPYGQATGQITDSGKVIAPPVLTRDESYRVAVENIENLVKKLGKGFGTTYEDALTKIENQHYPNRRKARELHAQALAIRLQLVKDAGSKSSGRSGDTAYLRAAWRYLADEKRAQREPDDAAWRAWDQSTGVAIMVHAHIPQKVEESLTRLSPAGIRSVEDIERLLDAGEPEVVSMASYGADAMNKCDKGTAKAPKAAHESHDDQDRADQH